MVSHCQGEYAARGTVLGLTPSGEEGAMFLTLSLGAAGAVVGVTAGSLVSLGYLALRFRFHGDGTVPRLYRDSPPARDRRETRKRLWAITLPIALGSLATSVAGLIDATILQSRVGDAALDCPQRLLAAYPGQIPDTYRENPQAIPTFLYGCYTLAMTIYLLVPGVTQAFGTSALPNVTAAYARGNKWELRSKLEAVVRVTALFCFPAGVGMASLSLPLTQLLYGHGESTPIIARCLFLLGSAALPAAMSGPLSSMLQAVGRADLPVKLLLGAMAIKLGANWVLCGIPELNIQGGRSGHPALLPVFNGIPVPLPAPGSGGAPLHRPGFPASLGLRLAVRRQRVAGLGNFGAHSPCRAFGGGPGSIGRSGFRGSGVYRGIAAFAGN